MTILIFISSKQVTLILMWRQTIPKGVLSFRLVHEPPKSSVVYTGTPNPRKMYRRSFIVFFMREPRHYTLPSEGESPVTSSPLNSCVWNVAFFVHWTRTMILPTERSGISEIYLRGWCWLLEISWGPGKNRSAHLRPNQLSFKNASTGTGEMMPVQRLERSYPHRGWKDGAVDKACATQVWGPEFKSPATVS